MQKYIDRYINTFVEKIAMQMTDKQLNNYNT